MDGDCVCGSGLKRLRCCGWRLSDLSGATAVARLQPLVEAAARLIASGQDAEGECLLLDALDLAPDCLPAVLELAALRQRQQNIPAAAVLWRRVLRLAPNHLGATLSLGMSLFGQARLSEAEAQARNAIRIAPDSAAAHNLMGMILTEANRPQIGEYHYRRVLALSGSRDPILLANLAWNLKTQGRMEEARRLYHESLRTAPTVRQTLLGFARLEEADRRFDTAQAVLDISDIAYPNDAQAQLARAVILGRIGKRSEAIAVIDGLAGRHDTGLGPARLGPAGLGPAELLEKGRLLDKLDRFDDAWTAFADGKRRAMALSGQTYLNEAAAAMIARLRGFFTASRLALLPRATLRANEAQPIFILGFPRSGTTLVEQSLSAHPAIAAGDELPLIHDLTETLPRLLGSPLGYPDALSELWMGDQRAGLDLLRDVYLQRARQLGVGRTLPGEPAPRHFTDKMPLNETHLGLIALIFPASPLIHVIRHPLDIMVSAFSNHFTHGFCCATALETAALHYARIVDLVAHYRAEMPEARYLCVRYEDIVAQQEASIRGLLEAIGEDFDPACLTFHQNQRYARTASYAQVTEPLYDRSVGRWRQYRRQLAPVLPILAPAMARLGYDVS
ncbi:sulfotransferase [Acidisoma cellulosilytica]|uniref:Sulfotransferase n=1 Tax=Acidisoma cellulosilyticum TaxID=2802395 RepID=A0A963YZQ9_9PROT|nr:sulfotransferase [Acidisoma cellulosilyticum]MCB8879170.1 sulfotransferase [Acidisoma cellulosilyticum]